MSRTDIENPFRPRLSSIKAINMPSGALQFITLFSFLRKVPINNSLRDKVLNVYTFDDAPYIFGPQETKPPKLVKHEKKTYELEEKTEAEFARNIIDRSEKVYAPYTDWLDKLEYVNTQCLKEYGYPDYIVKLGNDKFGMFQVQDWQLFEYQEQYELICFRPKRNLLVELYEK